MYALRALVVSLSIFALVCAATALTLRIAWPLLRRASRRITPPALADVLFAVLVSPVCLACLIVVGFALPSFLRFEPRSAEEDLGGAALVIAAAGAAFLVASVVRSGRSWQQTRRAAFAWSGAHCVAHHQAGVPAYDAHASGVLAVAGVTRHKLFISPDIAATLSRDELDRAIAHELVHVRRHDNLAKFAVVLCRVPGMKRIEQAWMQAVEMTADECAVRNQAEALDLASALVKVSRLHTNELPDLALGLAARDAAPLSARVERLLTYEKPALDKHSPRILWCGLAMLATLAASAVLYQPLLQRVYIFMEWLVR
jgi:BlaR1 peptidase M56